MTQARRPIEMNAPGKLIALMAIATLCMAYVMVALILDRGDTTIAWTTLGSIAGYLIGNGVGARRGEVTEGIWKPAERRKTPR